MCTDLESRPVPNVSFCIPTYNRSTAVQALVKRLLESTDTDIEVVVLDNGSSDDTLVRLSEIADSRLSTYSNGQNRGVIFNVLHVMLKGQGRYSVLMLDKDSVDPKRLSAFKAFLLKEQVACGYCEYHSESGRPPDLFNAGIPALHGVAYTCHHPTGYFFDSQLLGDMDIANRFADYEYVGHFPFDFVHAELGLKGRTAIYHDPLFQPEQLTSSATKSFGTNASSEDAFFSPKGRLKMAINFTDHIHSLPIPTSAKRRLIIDRLAQGLFAATFGYRAVLCNAVICAHYHIDTRRVGTPELIRTGFGFYRTFLISYSCRIVENDDVPLSHARIAAYFMTRLFRALKRRLVRRFT
jgi:glycosyltransferase involved in cell wall biosynthesis